MKLFLYPVLAAALLIAACNGQGGKKPAAASNANDSTKVAYMQFEKQVHDFGNVTQGEVVEYSFKFTNTGNKDLIIQKAEASCGCTVPEWPKEPIKPGETGYMKVKFDSHGRPEGYTEKELFIQANTNPPLVTGPRIQCVIVAGK